MQTFKNILVAVDVSQPSHPELERAQQIARYSGGSLHLVDVLRDLQLAARLLSSQWQTSHEELAKEKETALETLAQSSRGQGIETTSQLLRGNFSQQLIEIVKSRHIDLLVRSAKGARSSEPGPIGSTSNQLLRRAPCALWLTQGAGAANCTRILAAVDRLEEARKRLDPKRWSLLYAPSWRILTQDILPDFPANMHEPARKLATGMPLLPELE